MTDFFQNSADNVQAPATRAVAVTPSDSTPLTDLPKGLYIGFGGTLVLRGASGGDATFAGVPDGTILPFRAQYVKATGTSAGSILALY